MFSNMARKILSWFGLISVIIIGLFGFGFYFTLLAFLLSFIIGAITVLNFSYEDKKLFSFDLDSLDDPLQQTSLSAHSPKVLELFQTKEKLPKFDSRITGSETVDSFLNEIINIIVNDYVTHWYEVLTDDEELTTHTIKKVVLGTGANVANRCDYTNSVYIMYKKHSSAHSASH